MGIAERFGLAERKSSCHCNPGDVYGWKYSKLGNSRITRTRCSSRVKGTVNVILAVKRPIHNISPETYIFVKIELFRFCFLAENLFFLVWFLCDSDLHTNAAETL